MHPLDFVVIGLYVSALIGITLLVRRARNVEDFSVASRELPTPIVFATLAATYVGPGYSIGLVGKSAGSGYIWFFIFCAFCVQTVVVGAFIAPRIQQFTTARTVGDILGERYGQLTKFVAGILTIALLTGFVGVMARASGDVVSSLTGMPLVWAAIICTAVVIGYSTYGGIKLDISNDVFAFIVLSIGVPLLLAFVVFQNDFSTLNEKLSKATFSNSPMPTATVVGLVLSFLLGECLIPPYTVRALASKTPSDARRGFVMAAGFGVAWFFVCTSLGVLLHSIAPDEDPAGAFMFAMNQFLPPGLFALLLVAIVAIILSSWDSLLNCATTAFQCDIISVVVPRLRDAPGAVVASRILNVSIGVGAAAFAITVPGLVEALLVCYTLWAPTIVLPLVIAVLTKKVHPVSGITAIIAGGVMTGVWEWGLQQPFHVPSVLVGITANQLVFWSTHFILKGTQAPSWLLYSPTTESGEQTC